MHTNITFKCFALVETERTTVLDICEFPSLISGFYGFLLWKNEGEYAKVADDQVTEARRIHTELSSAPEGQLSTAGFPCIFWDDCTPVSQELAAVLLGEERDFYRDADKPQDGSHS